MEDKLHQKCQIKDYQHKDSLSVCRYSNDSENLNWAAQNLWLGRMRTAHRGLDIAAVNVHCLC